MDLNLSNHVAVVTGAASGIGRAIAEGFAAEGAKVAVWDLAKNVQSVADEIAQQFSVQTAGFQVDVTNLAALNQATEETTQKLGPVNHLAHSAAIGSGKFGFPFTNLSPEDWKRVLDVNIQGMVNVAHTISPVMTERKSGTMVFLASVAGQIGSQTDPPYSAAKAANINFAQCMAKDLAALGVRVNTVCPGMVKTPLNQSVWKSWHDAQPADKQLTYDEWAAEKIENIVPLKKWQEPADIANTVVFLSSEKAAHITGQTINVDGGYVMHW